MMEMARHVARQAAPPEEAARLLEADAQRTRFALANTLARHEDLGALDDPALEREARQARAHLEALESLCRRRRNLCDGQACEAGWTLRG